jgi:hypothetical protein
MRGARCFIRFLDGCSAFPPMTHFRITMVKCFRRRAFNGFISVFVRVAPTHVRGCCTWSSTVRPSRSCNNVLYSDSHIHNVSYVTESTAPFSYLFLLALNNSVVSRNHGVGIARHNAAKTRGLRSGSQA